MAFRLASAFVFSLALWEATAAPAFAQPAGGQRPPPPAVSVVTIAPESVAITNELPGRIAPTRIAEVRPRVSGIVVERVFQQGSYVKSGDILYRIDPAPFRVQVERARATLKRAEAARLFAQQQADRQAELRKREVGTSQQFESAASTLAQADADVALGRAGVIAAELDLEYSEVKAPISGRIGRANITEGALVSPTTGALATIQQLDPVYADFTQSASELLALRRALKLGAIATNPGEAKVRLLLDSGEEYKHAGRLLFSEAAVDETTGQVTLRGEFPNPDGELLPGLYVRVLIEQGVLPDAIAVPQQAIQRDAGGRASVFVVGADNIAQVRPVNLGRAVGNRWIVEDGLKAGDRVVVEGFQRMRPGAPVNPQPWAAQPRAAQPAADPKKP